MNAARTSNSITLRLNTLAACLALGLGAGGAAAGGTSLTWPRANHAPTGFALDHPVPRIGKHNRPNAGSVRHKSAAGLQRTAATIIVQNCDDTGSGSLRDAIGGANDGDTIDLTQLTCSTITLAAGKININAADLSLLGPGPQSLSISGNGTNQVFNGIGKNLTIDGLALTDGKFPNGGCIYAYGHLVLSNSTVTGCVAEDPAHPHAYGGGVDVYGDLTLTNSTVSGNTAQGDSAFGGGIYAYGNTVIENSIISNNSALAHGSSGPLKFALGGGMATFAGLTTLSSTIGHNRAIADVGLAIGGGVHVVGTLSGIPPTAVINRSTITGNIAHSNSDSFWAYGGGIAGGMSGILPLIRVFYARSVSVDINYSTVSNNSASSDCADCVIAGGGVNTFGKVSLSHSTVSGNRAIGAANSSATAYGGGVVTRLDTGGSEAGTITVSESTISGNSALGRAGSQGGYGRGGGVAALLSPAVISNSTVAFNVASTSGGGVIVSPKTDTDSTLQSSIVANNEAPMARDIGLAAPFSNNPGVTVLGDHNLVLSASANLALPADTLYADPGLQALARNGGPTETHAFWPDSPALDAGSNPNNDACDQRGVPFSRLFGSGVDIGAFESTGVPTGDVIFRNGFELTGCVAPPPVQ